MDQYNEQTQECISVHLRVTACDGCFLKGRVWKIYTACRASKKKKLKKKKTTDFIWHKRMCEYMYVHWTITLLLQLQQRPVFSSVIMEAFHCQSLLSDIKPWGLIILTFTAHTHTHTHTQKKKTDKSICLFILEFHSFTLTNGIKGETSIKLHLQAQHLSKNN